MWGIRLKVQGKKKRKKEKVTIKIKRPRSLKEQFKKLINKKKIRVYSQRKKNKIEIKIVEETRILSKKKK